MRLTAFAAAAVLAVVGAARSEEPTTEQLVKNYFAAAKEAAELFDSVKDKAGAEKAKPKLEALSKQFIESITGLLKRPKDDVQAAFDAQAKKFNPPAVEGAYNRMIDRVPAAAEVLADVPLVRKLSEGVEGRAKADAQVIIKGLQTYYTQNGRWPARLADMANLFEKGADAFKDPWGNEYKFEIGTKTLPDGMVVEAPYVWAERKVGDQVKVIGTKPVKKQ